MVVEVVEEVMGLEEEVSGGGDAKEKKGNERKKGGEIGKVEEGGFGRSWGSPAASAGLGGAAAVGGAACDEGWPAVPPLGWWRERGFG